MFIRFITTGGTIDKIYFDDKSDYQVGDPQIGETLRLMDVGFEIELNALMRKDSLHLTDQDLLAKILVEAPNRDVRQGAARGNIPISLLPDQESIAGLAGRARHQMPCSFPGRSCRCFPSSNAPETR